MNEKYKLRSVAKLFFGMSIIFQVCTPTITQIPEYFPASRFSI